MVHIYVMHLYRGLYCVQQLPCTMSVLYYKFAVLYMDACYWLGVVHVVAYAIVWN